MALDSSLDAASLQAALFQWLFRDTQRGVVATDAQFRVVLWNHWMEMHSGRPSSDVIGRSLFELHPETGARGIRECYEGALEGAVTVLSHGLHRFVLALPPTDPELAYGEMPQSGHIGPLACDGKVIGTITVVEDVSARLAAEIALRHQIEAERRARATAEQALLAKDEFLATLSHELRTPLNAVLGWSRILLDRRSADFDQALLQRGLQVIERNASTQAKMVDDMLDMARIVSGKLRLEMKSLDLVSVVLAAVDVIMPSAEARRIAVKTSVEPQTPLILGDQDRLQQIVVNLLSNAVKFSEPGSSIDVQLGLSGSVARLVVKDMGHGISAAFLPHVFERFRQADASSTRRHGGLGLGLALVRDLVEMHNGSVRAESAGEGRGAVFTVDLPALPSAEIRINPAREVDRNPRRLATVRVLLIEDEADSRDLACAALASCGADVSAVASSAEAVDAILTASPDSLPHVVVSDIEMPDEDGYVFIQQLRSLASDRGGRIPAVTVTGYSAPDDVNRALAAGYQLHLSKPVDPLALIEAVARLSRESV